MPSPTGTAIAGSGDLITAPPGRRAGSGALYPPDRYLRASRKEIGDMPTSLRNLSMPLRVLFTCFLLVLGIGYLAALAYLFLVDVEPHASKGQGVVEGIAEKYHGRPTLLETALQGAMSDRIGGPDKRRILQWVRAGAKADDFATIKPILDANCVGCHSANANVQKKSGGPVPSFETYEGLSALADVDTGPTI